MVRFLATQVGVDPALFAQYAWEGRTIETHRARVMQKMQADSLPDLVRMIEDFKSKP